MAFAAPHGAVGRGARRPGGGAADDWQEKYRHVDDVTCRDAVVMFIGERTILVWRVIPEYPEWYRVVFLGDPDDYAF